MYVTSVNKTGTAHFRRCRLNSGRRVLAFFQLVVGLIAACAASVGLASEKPSALSVAVFVSSDGDRCFSPGLVKAIKYFTHQRAEQINANGGIAGRPVSLRIYDDFENAETTVSNVRAAINDPSMVAMIGVPKELAKWATPLVPVQV